MNKKLTKPIFTIYRKDHGKVKLEVLSSSRAGSKVMVTVRKFRYNHDYANWQYIGIFEGTGGFKYLKDFNYDVAEKAAIEVASDRERHYEGQ